MSTRRAGVLRVAVLVAVAVCASCGSATTSIGPLTMHVPDGWQVTDREGTNLKLTDGTIAEPSATRAGTATAVFDIYVDSPQTPKTFVEYLKEQGITPSRRAFRIDGYDAERFGYAGSAVGGRQEAVFVPRWRLFILYRAAFREDDAAFLRGRPAFRVAVASIDFSGSPGASGGSGSASGTRHGPTRGKSARTAIAAPIAIRTNPS